MSRSKYGVRTDKAGVESRTCDNIVFHSKRECERYKYLKMLLRAGTIRDLELQKRYELKVNGIKICEYRADFVYTDLDGRQVVEDVKGMSTAIYALKKRLLEACYGLRVVET